MSWRLKMTTEQLSPMATEALVCLLLGPLWHQQSGLSNKALKLNCVTNCGRLALVPLCVPSPRRNRAIESQPSKIIIYMPGAPLMVPYQEFSTSSTGPAHRYQIHMLTGSYLLFRNQLMGNEGSYW